MCALGRRLGIRPENADARSGDHQRSRRRGFDAQLGLASHRSEAGQPARAEAKGLRLDLKLLDMTLSREELEHGLDAV
jgi:hypothetical protein